MSDAIGPIPRCKQLVMFLLLCFGNAFFFAFFLTQLKFIDLMINFTLAY